MRTSTDHWIKQTIKVILLNVSSDGWAVNLNYYFNGNHYTAFIRNPEVLVGNLITGTEISIHLYTAASGDEPEQQAALVLRDDDFLPEAFCEMLRTQPPQAATFFGLISGPTDMGGRYYMLRDHNTDGLLLCTGRYTVIKGKGFCGSFDGQWPLKYNIIENFFYGSGRPESNIDNWKHRSIKLRKIDDSIGLKNLNRRFRDYAAGWHRYNYFYSDDWSPQFYYKQAKLGFIAITHNEDGIHRLVPQLQREYAVLDWNNLVIDRGVKKILESNRLNDEKIRLNIDPDPETAIDNLTAVWKETWITSQYAELIKQLSEKGRNGNNRDFRIWGITLTAGGDNRIIAGELGYTIGKTYTSLSGFFHRGEKKYNNFGKLQMVLLADILKNAGIAFWNLGQPYMEYKIKLGAEVVPRGLFLKRWDKAIRGKTVDLNRY